MTFEIEGFTPLGVIGRGGFGTVHRAADDAHGREVAVKVLGRIADDSARRRFDRERRAMGTLSGHPTIGIVYTSGFTANEEPYIVMEMIRGGSLADRLENDGPLPVSDVLDLGVTLADALHHAHQGGVLHLDLKPENILMSRFGRPKIVDFGIAAIVDDESATSTIRATPSYADPQVLDGRPGTQRSDVYGLAATLFTLLDGSPPYSSGPSGLYRVMQRVALDPVPKLERGDVASEFAQLLHRAMAKDPSERPGSMDEFARLLRAVEAEPVTRRRASPRRIDRSRHSTPNSATPNSATPSSPTPSSPTPSSPTPSSPTPSSPTKPKSKSNSPTNAASSATPEAPLDGWPGQGERPRLPGPVDSSNPLQRPERDPSPDQAAAPHVPQTRAPSVADPQQGGPATPLGGTGGDRPRRSDATPRPATPPPAAAPSTSRHRTNTVAVAVLTTLAVILAAALAFFLVRRGDQTDDADGEQARESASETIVRETDTSEPVTSTDVGALATDDGTLPDVVGLRTSDARDVINASGFDAAISSHCFDTVESQSPEAGSVADDGSVVSLQFAPCVVPDFVGVRLPEARRIVDEEFVVGLLIGWPAHCDDLVLDQSVPAGAVVDPGSTVELTLEDDCSGG